MGLSIPSHTEWVWNLLDSGEGIHLGQLAHAALFFSLSIPSPWAKIESHMPEVLLWHLRGRVATGSVSSPGPRYINICSTQLSIQIQIRELRDLQSVDVDGHVPRGTCPYNDLFFSLAPLHQRALSSSTVCINDSGSISVWVLTLVIKYPKAIAKPLLSPGRLQAAH